jgi:hypothetical protein
MFNRSNINIVLGEEVQAVNNSPHRHCGRQPIDTAVNGSFCKEFRGLLIEPLHHCLHLTLNNELLVLSCGRQTRGSHKVQDSGGMGMVQHLPVHEVPCILDSVDRMKASVVLKHEDTLFECAGMLSLDGGMKVSGDSTILLCADGDVRVREG